MANPESDKKQLKSIFEESLKEISLDGTDPFRRAVREILEETGDGKDAKRDKPARGESKHRDLNMPKIQD